MQSYSKTLMTIGALAAMGQADSLPELSAKRDEVTVSGHSAGGHFACHLMWTNSSVWKGAGCSKGAGFGISFSDFKHLNEQMIVNSIDQLMDLDEQGKIDSLNNLQDGEHAVYIISGLNDNTVPAKNQKHMHRTFMEVGMSELEDPEDFLGYSENRHGHRFMNSYVDEFLQFLWPALGYGELKPKGNVEATPKPGRRVEFDQKEFYPESTNWNSSDFKGRQKGYVYIPNQCEGAGSKDCRLHFVLHGCNGRPQGFFNKGYEAYAITNDMIIVWPDSRCWDNHGSISKDGSHKSNNGTVHRAFRAMIDRLTGESDESEGPNCQEWADMLDEAEDSIASVADFLAGNTESWIDFDYSQFEDAPAECDLSSQIDELNQAKAALIDSEDFKVSLYNNQFSSE